MVLLLKLFSYEGFSIAPTLISKHFASWMTQYFAKPNSYTTPSPHETAIEESTRDPQTQELLILYLASYTSSSERASIHPTRALVLGTTIDSLHATLPHRREVGISKRLRILPLLVTPPTKKFFSPNCCYGTHMQACRSRTSWRWSSEDHAQEITTVRTTAKPWDVAAPPPPRRFSCQTRPKTQILLKIWRAVNKNTIFFSVFFFLLPRVDRVHLLPASSLSELLRSPKSNI